MSIRERRAQGSLKSGRAGGAVKRVLMAAAAIVLSLYPQGIQLATGVINVEVPVRVFDGDRFVDDLALSDFEILENGKPQTIAAFYFVQKTSIQKEEAPALETGQ